MCPDGPVSLRQFAGSCYRSDDSEQVICVCNPGYKGKKLHYAEVQVKELRALSKTMSDTSLIYQGIIKQICFMQGAKIIIHDA